VLAAGAIPYAEAGSTVLSGKALSFSSNKLSINVDAAKAMAVENAIDRIARKRTTIQSDCTGTKLTAVRTGLQNCARLATSAATAATSGSASKYVVPWRLSQRVIDRVDVDRS
jgi:deuterolysin